jgi:hypothetical protein
LIASTRAYGCVCEVVVMLFHYLAAGTTRRSRALNLASGFQTSRPL